MCGSDDEFGWEDEPSPKKSSSKKSDDDFGWEFVDELDEVVDCDGYEDFELLDEHYY